MFTLKMYDESGKMVDEAKYTRNFDEFMKLVNENVGKSVIAVNFRFKDDNTHYYGGECSSYEIVDKVEEYEKWKEDYSDRWNGKRTPEMIEEDLEDYESQVELWAIEYTDDGWEWKEKLVIYSVDGMVQVDGDTGISMDGVSC